VWIEKYFGYDFVKELIIYANKSLLKGDYLIDDNTSGKGQEGFEGELLHFGSSQDSNWYSIRKMLKV
jgi:5'(3')-deoxyribonucleotidase